MNTAGLSPSQAIDQLALSSITLPLMEGSAIFADVEQGAFDSCLPEGDSPRASSPASDSGASGQDDELQVEVSRYSPPAISDVPTLCGSTWQHQHFAEMHGAITSWLSCWGGLDRWNATLDRDFATAKEAGNLMNWYRGIMEHKERGRLLLHMAQRFDGALPVEMWMIREIWHKQVEILILLLRGMAYLEVRLDIMDPGPFSFLYNSRED